MLATTNNVLATTKSCLLLAASNGKLLTTPRSAKYSLPPSDELALTKLKLCHRTELANDEQSPSSVLWLAISQPQHAIMSEQLTLCQ